MNEKLIKIFNNKALLEKFLLAWYLSIPGDNTFIPYKLVINKIDEFDNICYSKINASNVVYGVGTTSIKELERYYNNIESMLNAEQEVFTHQPAGEDLYES